MKKRPPISRVFFIGAGFSAGMQYPIGKALMPELIRYLRGKYNPSEDFENTIFDGSHRAKATQLVELVKRFLNEYFRANLQQLNTIEVAEFFSVAHTLAETPNLFKSIPAAASGDLHTFAALYEKLAAATRTFFLDICSTVDPAPRDVTGLLRGLNRLEDAVVCFNWDEEVDFYLSQKLSKDVAYTYKSWRPEEDYLLLKPHGSIGWYDVTQGIGNDDLYFITDRDNRIPRIEKRVVSYLEFDMPKDVGDPGDDFSLTCPPVIMPPTFYKRFRYPEQQLIWQDVLTVCGTAKSFVFLGYRLPPDDFLTRAAIRSALQQGVASRKRKEVRCLVVTKMDDASPAPSKEFRENFESVFGSLDEQLNFMHWEFGCNKTFYNQLEAKLDRAVLTSGK